MEALILYNLTISFNLKEKICQFVSKKFNIISNYKKIANNFTNITDLNTKIVKI